MNSALVKNFIFIHLLNWVRNIKASRRSEFRTLLFAYIMQHYLMLSRNLVYTGLTRAKQLAILVGPLKAIGLAVKQVKDQLRYTLLAQRLIATSTDG